jgi:tRNA-specific 2-thiouridylase
MLRLWSEAGREEENRCCTVDALKDARSIAGQLDIPFYALDARETFHEVVVNSFINGYAKGITPNPCLVCNRNIRWGFLFKHARDLGGELLATGHYARVKKDPHGQYHLLKGIDPAKDQSYVLHVLTQEQLSQTLFPLGDYTKTEVRELAQRFNLPVSRRPDSQDLCFVGEDRYQDFLARNAPHVQQKGPIFSSQGEKLGEHAGLAFFTVGQRKGLGIAYSEPLYVLRKDLSRNALIVGTASELGKRTLTAGNVNWISGTPPGKPFPAGVRIRYQSREYPGLVTPLENDRAAVEFQEPIRDITPGQAAVFFLGDECIGGGIIQP